MPWRNAPLSKQRVSKVGKCQSLLVASKVLSPFSKSSFLWNPHAWLVSKGPPLHKGEEEKPAFPTPPSLLGPSCFLSDSLLSLHRPQVGGRDTSGPARPPRARPRGGSSASLQKTVEFVTYCFQLQGISKNSETIINVQFKMVRCSTSL